MKLKVGFIGLGLMGNPMAKNILSSGFDLTVYNRTPKKTIELEKLGAKVALSPADVAANSDVVITMVTGPEDVEEVLFGNGGAVRGAKKGLVVIDMSTIGPTAAKNIADELKKFDIEFIDAPVTGSTPKAITGDLTIFIGGNEKTFKKVEPVLLAMGKTLHHIGPTGSGQAVKLVNNFLVAADTIALSEAVMLADTMKLPREKVATALQTASGFSPAKNMAMPNYVSNQFPTKFSVANLKKDVSLAVKELMNSPLDLPILNHAEELYDEALKKNLGQEDFSAVIKVMDNQEI